MNALTEHEKAILSFEQGRWNFPGAKETAIRQQFGISANLYYQQVNLLLDRPEALAYDPMLIKRLRRLRDTRRARRTG